MPRACLILTPEDAVAAPPPAAQIASALTAVGLLGDPLAASPDVYAVGDRFLQLLAFLGCSPVVDLEAESGCRVKIVATGSEPLWRGGSNVAQPRCPACRQRVEGWREELAGWADAPRQPWRCPACARERPVWALDWRQQGGFGRLLVEIRGIYPAEAVPGEELLAALERASGGPWRYFYVLE